MTDAIVGMLLMASGLLVLIAALGLVRMQDFFLRMHAPSLAYTLGSWLVTLATIIHFSVQDGALELHAWLVIILLAITAPVTTVLLARAAVFRRRSQGQDAPPPLVTDAPAQHQPPA